MFNFFEYKFQIQLTIFLSIWVISTTPTNLNQQRSRQSYTASFDWTGKWRTPNSSDHFNFYIILKKKYSTSQLKGRHCYVTKAHIDCAEDDEITLKNFEPISSTVIEGDFITAYSSIGNQAQMTGRVQLKIVDQNTIQWWLKKSPTALPPTPISDAKITLKRVQ